jgi:nicotinamide riboside kinase
MVKDLARYFQCPYTTEYGRDYMEARNIKDPDLSFEEFVNFVVGQNQYYYDALNSPANKGVIISDTDNLVTLMYARAYVDNPEMKIQMDEYLTLYECVKHLNGNIKWDKIFVLPPRNEFVDDGARYMGQASMEERQANFDKLIKLLEDFGLIDKVEVLFSDFSGNFNRVKDYINGLYI